MSARRLFPTIVLMSLIAATRTIHAEDPWADGVILYAHGAGALLTDSSKAVGEPFGGGPSAPNNDAVVSLGGQGGVLILKYNTN